jgi:ketosteroid isomerase-like protein
MNKGFETPQAAEDAFYDAIEDSDLNKLMATWAPGDDIFCLMPMRPAVTGRQAVQEQWEELFSSVSEVEITVSHMSWLETADMAVHLVQESVAFGTGGQPQPPIYAVNVYRRTTEGWQLVGHQNSPAPPPLNMAPPGP